MVKKYTDTYIWRIKCNELQDCKTEFQDLKETSSFSCFDIRSNSFKNKGRKATLPCKLAVKVGSNKNYDFERCNK